MFFKSREQNSKEKSKIYQTVKQANQRQSITTIGQDDLQKPHIC